MAKEAAFHEIVEAGLRAATDGLDIVKQTQADQQLAEREDDGPKMQAWLKRSATSAPPPRSKLSDELVEMIGHCIVDSERTGRHKTAGVALTRLREHYDNIDPRDLSGDERSWETFATKHVPLPAERVAELIGKMVFSGGMLRCTSCGTFTRCACGCGRPYVGEHRWSMSVEQMLVEVVPERANEPSALDRAMAAVEANPEKSDRVIAAEIGVGRQTVMRARAAVKVRSGDGPPDGPPEKRVGRDGRSYPAAARRPPAPTPSDYFEAVNAFHGELVGFLTDFSGRFSAWREDAGPLDDEGKAALMQALYLCGDGFMRVAQELDGR